MTQKTFLALAILGIVLVSGCVQSSPTIGDTPTHISPNKCQKEARIAINQRGLTQIHSCNVEEIKVDSETVYLVKISYGPGMDCPAGCIYESYVGIVKDNAIFDSPTKHEAYKKVRLDEHSPVLNLTDFGGYLEDISNISVAKRNEKYGWLISFNKYLNGNAFVYKENGQITGDFTNLGSPKFKNGKEASAFLKEEYQKKCSSVSIIGYSPGRPYSIDANVECIDTESKQRVINVRVYIDGTYKEFTFASKE